MASARCETCGRPQGLKHNYIHLHTPVARVLCGAPTCIRSACVWLTDQEEREYLHGLRSFLLSNHAVHVQVV
jgi:hypothetical protein